MLHVQPPPKHLPLRQLQSVLLSNPEGHLPASSTIPIRFLKYLHVRSFQNRIQRTICHSYSSPILFSYYHACLSRAKQYAFSQSCRQDQRPTNPAEFLEQPFSVTKLTTRTFAPTLQNC